MVAIKRAIEPYERKKAQERQINAKKRNDTGLQWKTILRKMCLYYVWLKGFPKEILYNI